MEESVNNQERTVLDTLKLNGEIDIRPIDEAVDLEDTRHFKKMELTSGQKIQISALSQQLPSAAMAGALANTNLYVMKFPKGVPHTLMHLNKGGVSNIVVGDKGRIVAHASLYEIASPAVLIGAITAMSAVSGQYFLSKINNELKLVNQSLNAILDFLYGEKKAELIAEISFIKYVNQNYNSIIGNEQQATATIISLQEAKKVAMKDVQFYQNDLHNTIRSDYKDSSIDEVVEKAIQINKCLELSMQLYLMSTVLEVYYAQNYDPEYISYIENDICTYIKSCNKDIFGDFNHLQAKLPKAKVKLIGKKVNIEKLESDINDAIEHSRNIDESEIFESLHSVLKAPSEEKEYYIKDDIIYLKRA